MIWEFFSLLTAVLNSGAVTIDKIVLTKWIKNPMISVIVLGMIGLLSSITIFLIKGYAQLSIWHIILAMISGIFYMLFIIGYFHAMKIEEASRITPLISLTAVFVLIFATIFLGEFFTLSKYAAIFLLVAGAVIISYKKGSDIRLGKALFIMIIATIFMASSNVINKYLLQFADFWTIFGYVRLGATLILIPVFIINYADFTASIKNYGFKAIGLSSLSELLTLIAAISIIIGASIGPVSLVSALTLVQPFIVFIITLLLSRFLPHVLEEEISRFTIIQKSIAIVLMITGVILIS